MQQASAHSSQDFYDLFSRHVKDLTEHPNGELRGLCPFHDDTSPSWSGNQHTGLWKCFGCGDQGNAYQFAELAGGALNMSKREIVATYPYHDESGTLLYQVVRYDPRGFAQRRPSTNGGWVWNLDGIRRVLYRLPEILPKQTIFVVEGEKDADRLWSAGFPATTNPQGAGKWRTEYSETLRGKKVVILPDADEIGEKHAMDVAHSLLGVAEAIKIVRLPGLPEHGDVSAWLDAGHSKEELTEIVKATLVLRAEDLPQEPKGNGLALTKLSDLLNEPEERVDWLVDKILPSGGFSLVVAKPKTGKSTLARCLALAVARGEAFFNRLTQQGPVIYLALEEKRSEVRKHFEDMGATGGEEIYIHASTAPADALKQIRAAAEEKKPALIIIDPLFRLTRVKDGNDYAQVTQALEPLLSLARETGAHVLCVHHASKGERQDGDNILGSTAIFAAVDTALIMKRSERYRSIKSMQRYGEDLEETVLRFDPETRTVTLGESKEQEEEQRIADAILEFLEAKQAAVEEREIDSEVEGRRAIRKRALRSLVDQKRVLRKGEGKRGSPYLYALQENWFSGSRYTTGNQGTRNEKDGLSPQEDESYSGSQDFAESYSGSRDSALDPEVWEEEL